MYLTRFFWWASLALGLIIAWPALQAPFLSDDLGIMQWVLAWDREGGFWKVIGTGFARSFDVPNHFYRPLASLTYGFDYLLWGFEPLPWHLTGYALHIFNALLVGKIARALGSDALQAAAAAALFLLFPLAPEVVIWFSGRFDLLAVTGMLIAVFGHARAQGFDRWRALSLLGLALGLTAKEAAMQAPGLLVLVSLLRGPAGESLAARAGRTLREVLPACLVFLAYLGFRVKLFGTALQIYSSSDPTALPAWPVLLDRAKALAAIPRLVFADAPLAGALALGVIALGLPFAAAACWRERRLSRAWVLPVGCALLSLLALLPHLGTNFSQGEGSRFFYATAPWLALALVPALGWVRDRQRAVLAALFVASFGLAQAPVMAQWGRAGEAMRALVPALGNTAAALDQDDFALVLVPDYIGTVLFGRNAQGGMATPPLQASNLLPKLVPVIPADLFTWPQRIAQGDVAVIKGREVAPRLDALYCFDPRRDRLEQATPTPDWRDSASFLTAARVFARRACGLDVP